MTGPLVIRCLGLVGRVEAVTCDGPTPVGEYVCDYEPDKHGGRGEATFTRDLARAKTFPDVETAWRFIGQRPSSRPTRPDGKPNRPLMAFTLQILPVDGMKPIAERALPDGRYGVVWPLTFARARLHVARSAETLSYDDEW